MQKTQVYKAEHKKLTEIFSEYDEGMQKLVEGLIQDASFLFAENYELRNLIEKTGGMINVHPENKALQKQTEAGKQYLKNVNSYSTVIRSLNNILGKTDFEVEDEFDKWIKEKRKKDE